MVNCNPETVSTDYDTSDRLYFEPLTREDVLNVIAAETQSSGGVAPKVIVSLGGQTPLKLAGLIPVELVAGTSPASIDAAEDREKWNVLCDRAPHPSAARRHRGRSAQAPCTIVEQVGFPVLVRPSYVLGGRAMQIVHDRNHLARAMAELAGFGSLGKEGGLSAERPVLDRPLPRRRHRGRRRCHPRPHRRGAHRRRDGTRRGSRGALGRLRLRHPAPEPARLGGRGHRDLHPCHRRCARRAGPHQRPVRGERHDGLRHRGQPTGQPDRAVRGQGDRACRSPRWPAGSCSAPRSPNCAPRGS